MMPKTIKGLEKSYYNNTLWRGGLKEVFENINLELDKMMSQENTVNKKIVRSKIKKIT